MIKFYDDGCYLLTKEQVIADPDLCYTVTCENPIEYEEVNEILGGVLTTHPENISFTTKSVFTRYHDVWVDVPETIENMVILLTLV